MATELNVRGIRSARGGKCQLSRPLKSAFKGEVTVLDGTHDIKYIAFGDLVNAPTAHADPASRRSIREISGAERFCEMCWAIKASSRSSTRSATILRRESFFSAARSRPSSLAANTF